MDTLREAKGRWSAAGSLNHTYRAGYELGCSILLSPLFSLVRPGKLRQVWDDKPTKQAQRNLLGAGLALPNLRDIPSLVHHSMPTTLSRLMFQCCPPVQPRAAQAISTSCVIPQNLRAPLQPSSAEAAHTGCGTHPGSCA
eukprot:1160146-Pelagomonas_calceolata.AAC.11